MLLLLLRPLRYIQLLLFICLSTDEVRFAIKVSFFSSVHATPINLTEEVIYLFSTLSYWFSAHSCDDLLMCTLKVLLVGGIL